MNTIERIPLERLEHLNRMTLDYYCDLVSSHNNKKYNKKETQTHFNEVKKYIKNHIKSKGSVKCLYALSKSTEVNEGGRLFCHESIQAYDSVIRGYLFNGITTDIDMKNCHPVILKYICEKHDIHCPNLSYYVDQVDTLRKTVDGCKEAVLVAINSNKRKRHQSDFLNNIDKELKQIQKKLSKVDEYKLHLESAMAHKPNNMLGSFVNRIMCQYENELLQVMVDVITTKHKKEICALMFDGLMFYGEGNDEIIDDVQDAFKYKYNIDMKLVYKPHSDSIKNESLMELAPVSLYEFIASTDDECADIVYEQLKDNIISCKGQVFMKNKNIWSNDIEYIKAYIIQFVMKADIYKPMGDDKFTPFWRNYNTAEKILKTMLIKIKLNPKDNLYHLFHTTTLNRLCFIDGVLDFKTKSFIVWDDIDFEYFSCVQIPLEFKEYYENPDVHVMDEIKEVLLEPLFKNDMDKALHFFSRAFAGCIEDKNFATFMGNRDSGKGVLYSLLEAFGDYLKPFAIDNLLCSRENKEATPSEVAKKLYWLLDYEFCRLMFSQEVPENDGNLKLNAPLFKKLCSGGDVQTARRNYDRCDTNFTIDCTPFMAGNNSICVGGDMGEHHIEFQSTTQFKTQDYIDNEKHKGTHDLILQKYKLADPVLKNKTKSTEWKLAIIYLIYSSYQDKAVEIKTDYEDVDTEDMPILEQFLEKFEITNNEEDAVVWKDATSIYSDKKKLKAELLGAGLKIKKSKRGDDTRDKMCVFGVKRIGVSNN